MRPCVRLLPAFLEIGSLVFSDFWHKGVKWLCPKSDGARFSKKICPAENAGNMPGKPVFRHFLEISSLVFSHFCSKMRIRNAQNMAESYHFFLLKVLEICRKSPLLQFSFDFFLIFLVLFLSDSHHQ